MCRFLVYKGREMLMADLLLKSEQSLIQQSFKAREREEPLNGDGFGVGWYVPEIDPDPCVFVSTSPAWSNRNLHRLSEKIRSGCFFAHVRAASPGLWVNEANCHPFQFRRFLWMHNGRIADFDRIKRPLREALDDRTYGMIQGTTDSEHAFALFLDHLLPNLDRYTLADLEAALRATLARLEALARDARTNAPSYYNFAVTDGQAILATRYVTDPEARPESLYVSSGARFDCVEGKYRMAAGNGRKEVVILASEPLTEYRSDWTAIPPNHLVTVTPELAIRIAALAGGA